MRRGLGRGRTLIGIGAVVALVGIPLAWYTVGGEVLPAVSSNGFGGAGVAVFVAAVGMLAVLLLPYASRTGQSSFDRPVIFGLLVAIGLAGLVIEVWNAWNAQRLGLPDRAPGLWLAGVGMVLAAWGVGELLVSDRNRA